MTVNINIPDGKMLINVDLFLAQADIWKIRRMFKYLKESGIDDSTRYEMDAFLQDKLQEAEVQREQYAWKYTDELDRASELEEEYSHMESPCYPQYTRDKGKLAEKKMELTASKRQASAYKKLFRDILKLEKRYQKIQGIWVEIAGGGRS